MTTITLAVVLTVLSSLVVLTVADGLLAASRARTAADAAALAVLSGSALAGGDGAPAMTVGAAVAAGHGATISEVDIDRWPVAVVVRAQAPLRGWLAALVPHMSATGAARAVPPDDGPAGPAR